MKLITGPASWDAEGCSVVVSLPGGQLFYWPTPIACLHWKVHLEPSLQKSARSGCWVISLVPLSISSSHINVHEAIFLYPHRVMSFKWARSSASQQGIVLVSSMFCLPLSICAARWFILGGNQIVLSWASVFIGDFPAGLPFKCHRISDTLTWRKRSLLPTCVVTRERGCARPVLCYVFIFKSQKQRWECWPAAGMKWADQAEGPGELRDDIQHSLFVFAAKLPLEVQEDNIWNV